MAAQDLRPGISRTCCWSAAVWASRPSCVCGCPLRPASRMSSSFGWRGARRPWNGWRRFCRRHLPLRAGNEGPSACTSPGSRSASARPRQPGPPVSRRMTPCPSMATCESSQRCSTREPAVPCLHTKWSSRSPGALTGPRKSRRQTGRAAAAAAGRRASSAPWTPTRARNRNACGAGRRPGQQQRRAVRSSCGRPLVYPGTLMPRPSASVHTSCSKQGDRTLHVSAATLARSTLAIGAS
mmetsp:Transcript_115405/g.326168  ORF Transcript_115405/g.326168 Transcript_115405/m.326168 type:complete len:239 (+) Transcript_115405:520-1236(+)